MSSIYRRLEQIPHAHERKLLYWLIDNEEQIRNGSAHYLEQVVTLKSKFTRYQSCCTILFSTSCKASPFAIKGSPQDADLLRSYTMSTLVLGWWGKGALIAPWYILKNLFGGESMTVEKFLEDPQKQ